MVDGAEEIQVDALKVALVTGKEMVAAEGRGGRDNMAKPEDLSGKRFGLLTAIKATDKRVNGQVVWLCKCDCGNEIEVPAYSLKSGKVRSCGCIELGKKKPLQKRLYEREYSYEKWVTAVLEKDDYTCQACGEKRKALLKADYLTAFDNNPKFRTRIDNGVTLCENCYNDFHHQYGFVHNTQRQFERWLRHRDDS